jgi:hypothetical protein
VTVAPPRVPRGPAPGMRDRPSTTNRPSGHGAAAPVEAPRRPAITTPPNHPGGPAAGPGRRATRSCGSRAASHAPAAIPTSGLTTGPRRVAAVSTASSPTATGTTPRAGPRTRAARKTATTAASPTSRGAGGRRRPETTGRTTPSPRSVTAAAAPRTSRASRTRSAGVAHGHRDVRTDGPRPNPGSTTSSGDRERGTAGRGGSPPAA